MRSALVPGDVPYAALVPEGAEPAEGLPLIVVLHGADSSSELLEMLQGVVEEMWAAGVLAPSVIACASTPTVGGFYIDGAGGSWETLIARDFPQLLSGRYHIDRARVSLVGASMGGYGALKIAFADPGRWQAVAAVAPALLPAARPQDLRPRNMIGILGELARQMAGGGEDEKQYAENSVLHRLRENADAIRRSGLPIFLRCGDRDVFSMHDGTEQLHRALWDLDIGHDYHLVYGADHVGPEAVEAQLASLAFIGGVQRVQAGQDKTQEDRDLEDAWRRWASEGRQGSLPRLNVVGVAGPVAIRALLQPDLADAAQRDETAGRRYGLL
jgi:S-formylglutathione hydrolase